MYLAYIGFESLSQKSLASVNKGKTNQVDKYMEAIEKIRKYKIAIGGLFMVGLDGDNKSVFEEMFNFVDRACLPLNGTAILTPLPNTKLYHELDKQGRILNTQWDNYTCSQVCFEPVLMSKDELQDGFYWMVKKMYLFKNTLRRLIPLWKQGLFIDEFALPLLDRIKITTRLLKTMKKEKLISYIPIITYYFLFKKALLSSVLLALHFHQATKELPEPKCEF